MWWGPRAPEVLATKSRLLWGRSKIRLQVLESGKHPSGSGDWGLVRCEVDVPRSWVQDDPGTGGREGAREGWYEGDLQYFFVCVRPFDPERPGREREGPKDLRHSLRPSDLEGEGFVHRDRAPEGVPQVRRRLEIS